MMLMLNVPALVGLVALAEPIVALLYQRGAFTAVDTEATAAALMFYAPGLVGYSAVKIASPTFYSLGDSRTPVIVSMSSVAANLALNLTFIWAGFGFRGLALGTALAALFNATALLWLLRGRLRGLDDRRLWVAFSKIVVASLVMGIVAIGTSRWLSAIIGGEGEWVKAVLVGGSIATALAALAVSARLLRIAEFNEAVARVLQRVRPGRR
jgi:putative peptidoglycan lipid II flippase